MNVNIKMVDSFDALREAGPGAAFFPNPSSTGTRCIVINCPGCGRDGVMDIYLQGQPKPPSPSWEMSNEPERMTLKPSINCVGCCKWHGWLTDGVFKSC